MTWRYHHPYIYELEVMGYEDNGTEIIEWNRKRNPEWSSVPKNSGVEDALRKKWDDIKEDLIQDTEENVNDETTP